MDNKQTGESAQEVGPGESRARLAVGQFGVDWGRSKRAVNG